MAAPKQFFYISKHDYILTGLILLICVIVIIWLGQIGFGKKQLGLVHQNNHLIEKIDLTKDKLIHAKGMVIEVKAGALRVKSSDCPYKICQQLGWIAQHGQSIVCVPNRILIEIRGESTSTNYHAVSY